jgi:hypothetical protein|tara:strand:+ start:120 stop:227 length:108 start_codon:yes stop_codon:yes gene_type:complete
MIVGNHDTGTFFEKAVYKTYLLQPFILVYPIAFGR